MAWAETQTVAAPPGPDAMVVAVLVPGEAGGEVCGDRKTDEHVNFNTGGDIVVNGEVYAGHNLNDTYAVTLIYRQDLGMMAVEITVLNESTGEMVYTGSSAASAMPASFSASGEQIILLTAH